MARHQRRSPRLIARNAVEHMSTWSIILATFALPLFLGPLFASNFWPENAAIRLTDVMSAGAVLGLLAVVLGVMSDGLTQWARRHL